MGPPLTEEVPRRSFTQSNRQYFLHYSAARLHPLQRDQMGLRNGSPASGTRRFRGPPTSDSRGAGEGVTHTSASHAPLFSRLREFGGRQ